MSSFLSMTAFSSLLSLLACDKGDDLKPPGNVVDPPGETTPTPVDPLPEATCDPGLDVWVQRVFPLVLGRKPHGAAEVQMWARFAELHGRPAVIRAMATSPEYRRWWKVQLSDLLYAARSGYGEDSRCFERPKMNNHDGSLAQWIRTEQPDVGHYQRTFNMADVIIDGLVADDISVIYQANLFARTNYTSACAGFDPETIETERRIYHGDQLLEVYIDRDLDCMGCHNSEYSVTDDADPALDRSWGRGALFERALFGDSAGPLDPDAFYAMNRFYGVVQDIYFYTPGTYNWQPWGMDAACGSFSRFPPEYDFLGQDESFFGGIYGPQGSLWDIERLFDAGVNAMSGEQFEFASDGTVEPDMAFAYLTAQHFVDQTWRLAFGTRLLLPYGMSRNADQQARLQQLTDAFVSSGWSLADLLVGITSDPYFNAGLPDSCGSQPYGMKPVIDPYSVVNEGELAGNGPGDLVHRHTARTLLRSFYNALDYGEPPEYFGFFSGYGYGDTNDEDLQRALGVFHSDASPGFNGVDFQGVLTWEGKFATCADPTGGAAGNFLRDLYNRAINEDATVEALALTLKDRLTARGVFEDETERTLVQELLGYPLETLVDDTDRAIIARNMGLLCGVLTLSPEFMLTAEPRPSGPIPPLQVSSDEDCENLRRMADMSGIEVTCEGGMPVGAVSE